MTANKTRLRQRRESDKAHIYLKEEGLKLKLRGQAYRPQLYRGKYKPPADCNQCKYLRHCHSLVKQSLPVHCEDTAYHVVSGANQKTIILTV